MTKPRQTIKADGVGTLKLSKQIANSFCKYVTNREWAGRTVELVLYTDPDTGTLDETIRNTVVLFQNFDKVSASIKEFVTNRVVAGVNEHMEEDRDPISASCFLDDMKISLISVEANGETSFWYEPSDDLLGHGLMLSGNVRGEILDFDF